jgi:hypothetical protein
MISNIQDKPTGRQFEGLIDCFAWIEREIKAVGNIENDYLWETISTEWFEKGFCKDPEDSEKTFKRKLLKVIDIAVQNQLFLAFDSMKLDLQDLYTQFLHLYYEYDEYDEYDGDEGLED